MSSSDKNRLAYAFERDAGAALKRLCGDLKGKKMLAALSGGADSVCLLRVLVSLSEPLHFQTEAVHINHLIRGAEADRDESFCRELCGRLGVKLSVLRIDVPAAAEKEKKSLELCAREIRYAEFEKLSGERGIDFIATAHTADDNAETVLYNVLRGSGLDGLCGIPEKRGNIIRPLLSKKKSEILDYLQILNAPFVTDSTNFDFKYTRNFLRNELLPSACRVNPDAVGALNRLSKAAFADACYLNELAEAALSSEEPCRLDLLPEPLKKRAVRAMCRKFCGCVPESRHTDAVCAGLASAGEKRFSLPNGFKAVTCGGTLRFERASGQAAELETVPLAEGENFLAGGAVRVELRHGTCQESAELSKKLLFHVSLDSSGITGALYARKRRTGDSLTVRNIKRSVKKSFINRKVPASVRDYVPVICDSSGIVYVPFIGAADRVYTKNCVDTLNITVAIERVGRQ